jgi:hypothetical protein
MNGAEALIRTHRRCGLDGVLHQSGTSEMHFVAALDRVPDMRGVLTLFEGVATGRRRRLRPHDPAPDHIALARAGWASRPSGRRPRTTWSGCSARHTPSPART